MKIPSELRYTKTHEWAKLSGSHFQVGLTDYAQKEISDVVFVELPKVGSEVSEGKPCAVVESVKAAFDIYAPASGKIVKVNGNLEGNPALINDDCYSDGWLFEIESSQSTYPTALLTAETYTAHLSQASH